MDVIWIHGLLKRNLQNSVKDKKIFCAVKWCAGLRQISARRGSFGGERGGWWVKGGCADFPEIQNTLGAKQQSTDHHNNKQIKNAKN